MGLLILKTYKFEYQKYISSWSGSLDIMTIRFDVWMYGHGGHLKKCIFFSLFGNFLRGVPGLIFFLI